MIFPYEGFPSVSLILLFFSILLKFNFKFPFWMGSTEPELEFAASAYYLFSTETEETLLPFKSLDCCLNMLWKDKGLKQNCLLDLLSLSDLVFYGFISYKLDFLQIISVGLGSCSYLFYYLVAFKGSIEGIFKPFIVFKLAFKTGSSIFMLLPDGTYFCGNTFCAG